MNLRILFDRFYEKYNRRDYIHPDPLEFLHRYDDPADREIVGLIAACFAFGNVRSILNTIELVLQRMGSSPTRFLQSASRRDLMQSMSGIQHRWATSQETALLLLSIKRMCEKYGSLQAGFVRHLNPTDEHILAALTAWVHELQKFSNAPFHSLLSDPAKGSACKRLHLFLRWMVRQDDVDPGGWAGVSPAQLLVPMDVHMHRIARILKMTKRNQANGATALEVTNAFRKISPRDPVRYDFALTRLGIRDRLKLKALRATLAF